MRPERFTNLFALIFGLLTPFFVQAEPASDELGLKINLSGESFTIPQERSIFFGPAIDLTFRHTFDEYFEAHFDAGAEIFTGSSSGALPKDILGQNGPRQDFRMHEAVVEAHDADRRFDGQLGAVNQQFVNNPLLFGDFAFLAAREDVRLTDEFGKLSLGFEEGVPPSNFSLLDSAASSQTPTFFLAHVDDQAGDAKADFVRLSAGYFQFNGLTTEQARQSLYAGNTVVGNYSSAQFFLPYHGLEASAGGGFLLAPKWQALVSGSLLKNNGAPAGSNFGGLGKFGINYRSLQSTLGVEAGYFYDQSDTSPAVFADASLSSKDHRGIFVGGRYTEDVKRYSIYTRWTHGEALVPGLYMGKDDTVIVGMEIRYELLR